VTGKGRYADEILRMCDLVGPQHVAFGTDMEGVGPSRVMSDYGDLRDVVDDLLRRGIDEKTLHGVFIGNYARVVRAAMAGAVRT
jgi:microsomal dipeptidase-like Zn-dependent dipeptidase